MAHYSLKWRKIEKLLYTIILHYREKMTCQKSQGLKEFRLPQNLFAYIFKYMLRKKFVTVFSYIMHAKIFFKRFLLYLILYKEIDMFFYTKELHNN